MQTDRYGRTWPDNYELCPTCGQPDNCGDCTHGKLTDDDVTELGGFVSPRLTQIVESGSADLARDMERGK